MFLIVNVVFSHIPFIFIVNSHEYSLGLLSNSFAQIQQQVECQMSAVIASLINSTCNNAFVKFITHYKWLISSLKSHENTR